MMKKLSVVFCLCGLLSAACTREEWGGEPDVSASQAVFSLYTSGYDGADTRSSVLEKTEYDRVEYYIFDAEGEPVKDIKIRYEASASEIHAEGLHEGEYSLAVLGIRGDVGEDRAEIHELGSISDTWISFPADLHKPLEAEYFYSLTPFSVHAASAEGGLHEEASIQETVVQKRIAGRVDFGFSYRNKYVGNSMVSKTLKLGDVRFATSFSGDGTCSGESDGKAGDISLDEAQSYCFMPTAEGSSFSGKVEMLSVNYKGEKTLQGYAFEQEGVSPNHINTVLTPVLHPDDKSGVIFMTEKAYAAGGHKRILQDDEPKEVYTDNSQRSFDTSQPLQVSVTEEGKLHIRFYCPRPLTDVLIKGKLPVTDGEYVDIAYFESIPPFADFYEDIPLVERAAVYLTESGRRIEIPRQEASALQGGTFKAESDSECWKRLQYIKYSMGFQFNLFGSDPDAPDGGPNGNWIGIRPVHCREMVAFFLNFAYMVSMPELETLMKENADKLYDDAKQPVAPERVVEQMRQYRYLSLGLVRGVSGLGSPSVWGVSEGVLKGMYYHASSLGLAFHEFGHVMGYDHKSAFTYGPWAESIINNFYLKHLKEFPVDDASYVDLANNGHLYNK